MKLVLDIDLDFDDSVTDENIVAYVRSILDNGSADCNCRVDLLQLIDVERKKQLWFV